MQKGFTLLELIVTVTVFAILTVAAIPNFRAWIGNSKVRTVADGIEQGLRQAETEAARQSRRVDFSLTSTVSPAGSSGSSVLATAVSSGARNWAITTEPLISGESSLYVAGSSLGGVADGVTISGPATTTFNSVGQLIGVAIGTLVTFNVTTPNATHPLNVTVSTSGQIRVCDPSRSISTSPDGCPP